LKRPGLSPPTLPSWNAAADEIRARFIEHRHGRSDHHYARPFMVCLVGMPGSGKTTGCAVLSERLEDIGCLVVPFDGYHLPMELLRSRPNASDLIYRRGAPDTFDPVRLAHDLTQIRMGAEPIIQLPGFDHANGDPEEGAHIFDRKKHNIFLCEGLYLLHDSDGFGLVFGLFDFGIYLDVDIEVCMQRVKIRNTCIPGYTKEELWKRVDVVDYQNALIVERSRVRAHAVVRPAPTTGSDQAFYSQSHSKQPKRAR
jgi:pantothenate kinase